MFSQRIITTHLYVKARYSRNIFVLNLTSAAIVGPIIALEGRCVVKIIKLTKFYNTKLAKYIYIFTYFSDIHSTMSSQKWLTSHSKYRNTSAGVGDSVARQARDVLSTPTQCWSNVYDVDPPPNQPRPNTPAMPDGKSGSVLHNHPH